MAANNGFADDLLSLIITNVSAANVGDGPGLLKSAGDGNYHISLHTVALGPSTADQGVNEAAYSGPYARVAVARNVSDWSVASQKAQNDNVITFPTATSSETEVHFGMGFATSGATKLDMDGDLTSDLAVSNGVTPEFAVNALDIDLS